MAHGPLDTGHPDLVALDLLRTGEGASADQAHLEGCARCRQVLRELRALAIDLRRIDGAPVEIPVEIDQRMAWNARKRAAAIRRLDRRGHRPILRPGWAAAAALLLALGGVGLWQRGTVGRGPALVAQGDIDGDGRLDIIDALALARGVESGAALDPAWDVNGDGVVDQGDAAALAQRAVTIEGA